MKNIVTNFIGSIILLTLLSVSSASAQYHKTVHGRIVYVSGHDNALIVKLQVRGEDDTDPSKVVMLTNTTLWFSYDDELVTLAQTPVSDTDTTLLYGDYNYPELYSPYFVNETVTHRPVNESGKEVHYALSHFVWEGWIIGPDGDYIYDSDGNATYYDYSDTINEWKDIAFIKLNIKKSGLLALRWNVVNMKDEILDLTGNIYNIGDFEDLEIYVNYEEPVLQLSSIGDGTASSPLDIYIKSTDAVVREAGTAGFYIYYQSSEASFNTAVDKLNTGSFNWNTGTITNETITPVFKDMIQYDRRIRYENNDGTQSNDYWPIATSTGINALQLVFKDLTLSELTTYLEVISQTSFKNHDETTTYPTIVKNANAFDPLPVTLLSFTGKLIEENRVDLNWITTSEKNSDKFEVERSKNGSEFETIAKIKGNGTTNKTNQYKTSDLNPLTGVSYYRLKQTDYDGSFTYSKVIAVNNSKGLTIRSVYPNPFRDAITIDLSLNTKENLTISVTDVLGRVVENVQLTGNEGSNLLYLDNFNQLRSGIYFVNITNGTEKATYKLQKSE